MTIENEQKIWFISRHPGAWDWFLKYGNQGRWKNVEHVSHIDIDKIRSGDIVIGTLPIHLAAEICDNGAQYWYLSISVPEHLRGKELTCDDMTLLSAKLEQYEVRRIKT